MKKVYETPCLDIEFFQGECVMTIYSGYTDGIPDTDGGDDVFDDMNTDPIYY